MVYHNFVALFKWLYKRLWGIIFEAGRDLLWLISHFVYPVMNQSLILSDNTRSLTEHHFVLQMRRLWYYKQMYLNWKKFVHISPTVSNRPDIFFVAVIYCSAHRIGWIASKCYLTDNANCFRLQTQVRATAVVQFLLVQAVPYLDQVESAVLVAGHDAAVVTHALLKLLAQLVNYVDSIENPQDAMQHVFKALLVSRQSRLLGKRKQTRCNFIELDFNCDDSTRSCSGSNRDVHWDIICHDFFPLPRRGSHVKSDNIQSLKIHPLAHILGICPLISMLRLFAIYLNRIM